MFYEVVVNSALTFTASNTQLRCVKLNPIDLLSTLLSHFSGEGYTEKLLANEDGLELVLRRQKGAELLGRASGRLALYPSPRSLFSCALLAFLFPPFCTTTALPSVFSRHLQLRGHSFSRQFYKALTLVLLSYELSSVKGVLHTLLFQVEHGRSMIHLNVLFLVFPEIFIFYFLQTGFK